MGLRFSDGRWLALSESPDHLYRFGALLTNSFSITPVLTNLHQDLDYEALKASLPAGVEPAFDGLVIGAEVEN